MKRLVCRWRGHSWLKPSSLGTCRRCLTQQSPTNGQHDLPTGRRTVNQTTLLTILIILAIICAFIFIVRR